MTQMFQSLAGNVSAAQREADNRTHERRQLCAAYVHHEAQRTWILARLAQLSYEDNLAAAEARIASDFKRMPLLQQQVEIMRRDVATYAEPSPQVPA